MKPFLLASLATTFTLAALSGCSKESGSGNNGGNTTEGYQIEVTGLMGVDDVARVKAMTLYADNRFPEEIASADHMDGNFTIELPNPIAARQLETITSFVLNLPEGVTMTPASFQGVIADFWAYNASGRLVGSFEMLELGNIMGAVARYYYSDRVVTITGSYTNENGDMWIYDVSFSKGWNLVYQTQEGVLVRDNDVVNIIMTMSTKKIMNEKWFYLKL